MTAVVAPLAAPRRRTSLFPAFVGASLVLHALGLFLASRHVPSASRPSAPAQMVVVEVLEPPPLPPPAPPPPHLEQRPRVAPKLAGNQKPTKLPEPPPPNDAPPPVPGPPPPVVVGLTLQSTTTANSVSVPVGNTLMGRPASEATAPSSVRPGFEPSYSVDTLPVVLEEVTGAEIYPAQATKIHLEGQVVMTVTVEADGKVSAAEVLSGPGHGLNEAARGAMLKFRFKPATKGGHPVATTIHYTYTFVLND